MTVRVSKADKRALVKSRGWRRTDRHNEERWTPPGLGSYGLSPNPQTLESAYRREKKKEQV